MHILPHLTLSEDEESGLILEIEGSELFDYIEEFLIETAPAIYAAIDDVEIRDDFSSTRIYFSAEIDLGQLNAALATIDPVKLEAHFQAGN